FETWSNQPRRHGGTEARREELTNNEIHGQAKLIIKKKFLGVDQRPDQVLVPLAEAPLGPAPGEVGQAGVAFLGGGGAGVGEAIEPVELLAVGAGLARQAGGAGVLVADHALEVGRVPEEQALRQAGVGRPLAFADALAPGAPEGLEEGRGESL